MPLLTLGLPPGAQTASTGAADRDADRCTRPRASRERRAGRAIWAERLRQATRRIRAGVEAGARPLLARRTRVAGAETPRPRSSAASPPPGRPPRSRRTGPRATSGSPPTWARSPRRRAMSAGTEVPQADPRGTRARAGHRSGLPAGVGRPRARPLVLQGAAAVRRQQGGERGAPAQVAHLQPAQHRDAGPSSPTRCSRWDARRTRAPRCST